MPCAARSWRWATSTASTSATSAWSPRRSNGRAAEGRPAIVATFDPHPVRHFAPHVPPFRLTTLDQREELFAAAGADAMLVFHFDGALAATTAEDFVGELLGGHIGAAGVVTGEDFTFGKGRGGNVALLAEEGARHGIAARAVGPVMRRRRRRSPRAASATRSRPATARPRRG